MIAFGTSRQLTHAATFPELEVDRK